ncbi:MAG TPA: cytochrome c [Tepidisphaeraceae bacterium]|nr:cytochrome c [Tepidisphaeraceae bacterium]
MRRITHACILLALTPVVAVTTGCDKVTTDPKLLATAAHPNDGPSVVETTGNAERGRTLFAVYGCTSCHRIPGVEGADGVVGPPLERMALRGYVAGVMTNTPANLVRWIQDPPGVDPMTAMPKLNVPPQDAHDMAAYLYTLK